jgi:hypothetical protein
MRPAGRPERVVAIVGYGPWGLTESGLEAGDARASIRAPGGQTWVNRTPGIASSSGCDRDLLDYRGGGHKSVEDRDPAATMRRVATPVKVRPARSR